MRYEWRKMKKSQFVSLVAIFAALNVVCDSITGISLFEYGVWWSWIFLMVPLTGIVLGPYAGFLSTFIGVMIGHFIYFRGTPEFLFTVGAPVGAMVSGLLFEGKWKTVFAYYTVLFVAYFITPLAWQLPIWGMWDTYLAYAGLLVILMLIRKSSWKLESRGLLFAAVMCAFIGLEADILFRIFLLVPCRTYWLIYGWPVELLQWAWALGAAVTPVQVAISTLVTAVVGPPLIKVIRETGFFSKSM